MSAFKLLGRLAGTRLPLTSSGARALDDVLANGVRDEPDVDGMATRDGSAIQVLLWNYHDDIVNVAATPVHLSIKVPRSFGAVARVAHLRVDESHGDAYTVWVAQGMPQNPSAEQVAALQQAMEPSALVPDAMVAVSADGFIGVDFELPRFGVSLVTILPSAAEGNGGSPGTVARTGCSCHIGGGDYDAGASLLLGISALALARNVRRRSARCAGRFC
jgi:xylan 1,4-beta-xylosidase